VLARKGQPLGQRQGVGTPPDRLARVFYFRHNGRVYHSRASSDSSAAQ
jgi:hypothetical protein